MSRTRARAFVAAALIVAVVCGAPATATSDPVSAAGWWTSTNPGVASPIPTLAPTGSPSNLPSDIPAGGFEVANAGPDQSYAAIGYDAYGGATVERVVLKVASAAAAASPGAAVVACPLAGDGSFAAVSGGPLASGPKYSCDSSVPGQQDANAGTVTFDVAPLVHGTRLAIAIVMQSAGRLVFAAPDDSTIVASAPPSVATSVPTTIGSAVAPHPATVVPPRVVTGAPPVLPPVTSVPAAIAAASPQPVLVTLPDGSVTFDGAVVGVLIVLAGAVALRASNRRALASR